MQYFSKTFTDERGETNKYLIKRNHIENCMCFSVVHFSKRKNLNGVDIVGGLDLPDVHTFHAYFEWDVWIIFCFAIVPFFIYD